MDFEIQQLRRQAAMDTEDPTLTIRLNSTLSRTATPKSYLKIRLVNHDAFYACIIDANSEEEILWGLRDAFSEFYRLFLPLNPERVDVYSDNAWLPFTDACCPYITWSDLARIAKDIWNELEPGQRFGEDTRGRG